MHLGLRIKVARISRKITQAELAEKINKTRPLISSIEQTGKVNFYTLKKICDVLGLDIDVLTQSTEDLGVFTYKGGSDSVSKEKIKSLEQEVDYLKRLVESQADLIRTLKGLSSSSASEKIKLKK